MPLVYLDASAIVKLIIDEPGSRALRSFLADADLISSELVLTEVPRAVHRAASFDAAVPLDVSMTRAAQVIDAIALVPLDRGVLLAAGALDEAPLRALDAIHVASAITVGPLAAFVSYDDRQAAAARLAGVRTVAPGVGATQGEE